MGTTPELEGLDEPGELLQHLAALWLRVRRRWWFALALAVAGGGMAALEVSRRPQTYESAITLLVENRPPRVLDHVTEVNPEEQMADRDRFVNSQLRILSSQQISERVEDKVGAARGSLAGRINATIDRSSHAVLLSVADPDPDRARVLVKTFAETFIAATVSDRTGVVTDAAQFLDLEGERARARLEDDEKQLYRFLRENELPASNFEESHKISSSVLDTLQGQAAQARAQGIRLKAVLAELEVAEGKPALQRLLVEDRDEDRRDRAVEIELQLEQLEARYGEQHPKVVEAREALAAARRHGAEHLGTAKEALRARLRANQAELAQLTAAIAEENRRAVGLRQKELDYNRLKRKHDEDREAYQFVARRQRELELQATTKQSYVRWLEGPSPAVLKSRGAEKLVATGLLLGLLAGLGLALLLDLLDDRVRSPLEFEREVSHPLLGIMVGIPEAATGRGDRPAGQVDQEIARAEHIIRNPRSTIAEQCQSFTTQIYSLFLDQPPRALMVASAGVEDGKTLVATHLAATVAARGKKVLLIDADLRRGRLHRLFQLSKRGGLFELVIGRVTLDEAIRRTWLPNVDVITTGDLPEKLSPLRIFEHRNLAPTVQALKGRYDLVLFDTPPLPIVSDALLLGPLIDGVVGVARAARSSRRLTNRLAEQLAHARLPFLGWVLNDVSAADLKHPYYARYGYSYGRGAEQYVQPPAV